MILFELVAPGHENSPNAVVYLQGQSYILFNKLQIKLDRVLDANEDWMGCYLDPGRIHFMMRRGDGMVAVAQSAKIVSTTTSERLLTAPMTTQSHMTSVWPHHTIAPR